MRYSLLAGGKRIRPVLALATADAIGRERDSVLPLAAALELIHTYSLIHDDLPAMDDDDLRRGRLTCHKVFGEDVAILAGDALYAEAFKLLLTRQSADPANLVAAAARLASATGVQGMVGGQYIDVSGTAPGGADGLRRLHELKTGRLIGASIECVLLLDADRDDGPSRGLPRFRRGARGPVSDRRRHSRRDRLEPRARQAGGGGRATGQAHVRDRVRTRRGAPARGRVPRTGACGARRGGSRGRRGARADNRFHCEAKLLMPNLLDTIKGPADLHGLTDEQLQQVAQEVREHIIDTVGEIGGHFGANLGVLRDRGRAALAAGLAAGQDPLGRRPSGVSAQDPDGPRRPAADDPPVRRTGAVLLDPGVRARHHGRRPRLDRDRLCGRDQGGDAARVRRGRPRRGGRRRRRADRRGRVRGRPPGGRRGHPDRRRAQRQRDVDRAQRRRDEPLLQPGAAQARAVARP